MKKRVAIIGGGYGGIRVMQHLSAHAFLDVTLIDQHPFHFLQTEAYALIAQQATLADVTVDLPALCHSYKNVTFVKALVEGVDFKAKRIDTDRGSSFYDYVVIAVGSRTFYPDTIPGLPENSHGVKSLRHAFAFRQQFEQELFARLYSEGDEEACRVFKIVVAGAGLSGVEIAAEMADYSRRFIRTNRMLCDGVEINLIASHDEVLEGMHPHLKYHAQKRLLELGVRIVANNRVTAVEPNRVLLTDGSAVAFDFMIFAGGVIAATLTEKLDVERNRKGQIEVTPEMAVVGREDAFAVGDVAAIKGSDGRPVPATANGAEKEADLVAANVLRSIRGERLLRRPVRLEGFIVALGRYNAAVVLFDFFKFSGLLGYFMKRLITNRYKLLLDNRAYKTFRRPRSGA